MARKKLLKTPVLDAKTLIVLAAVTGGSNLGMDKPSKETVQRLLNEKGEMNMDRAVVTLWQGYMESDEHYDMFMKECNWWLNDRGNFNKGRDPSATPEYIRNVWPDIAHVMGFDAPTEAKAGAAPSVARNM